MRRPAILVAGLSLVGVGLVVAAFALRSNGTPPESVPQQPLYRGSIPPAGISAPEFTLRSYRGPMVSMRALRGRVVIATFLDTACTEKCPLFASIVGRGMRSLSPLERRHTTALAISVQPRVDTPVRVRRFLRRRRALGVLDFLIGSPRALRPVWRDFAIVSAFDSGNTNVHSADLRIFDPRGIWVSTLHAGVDLTAANLAHDVRVALLGGEETLSARFARLSRRHTNKCALQPTALENIAVRGRLQGSCCFPMKFARYAEQVIGLRQFAGTPLVPPDPYDVDVSLARELIQFDHKIVLTPAEQRIYDEAVPLSVTHGPCCCRCWRWTAFRGQAKELIAHRGWSARAIARLWGLEEGCGGA